LISFITLAVVSPDLSIKEAIQGKLIVWIFAMRFLMGFLFRTLLFYQPGDFHRIVQGQEGVRFRSAADAVDLDRRHAVHLHFLCMSYLLISDLTVLKNGVMTPMPHVWWQLAMIISCGTLAAVLIPEFTKIFTSSKSNTSKK